MPSRGESLHPSHRAMLALLPLTCCTIHTCCCFMPAVAARPSPADGPLPVLPVPPVPPLCPPEPLGLLRSSACSPPCAAGTQNSQPHTHSWYRRRTAVHTCRAAPAHSSTTVHAEQLLAQMPARAEQRPHPQQPPPHLKDVHSKFKRLHDVWVHQGLAAGRRAGRRGGEERGRSRGGRGERQQGTGAASASAVPLALQAPRGGCLAGWASHRHGMVLCPLASSCRQVAPQRSTMHRTTRHGTACPAQHGTAQRGQHAPRGQSHARTSAAPPAEAPSAAQRWGPPTVP